MTLKNYIFFRNDSFCFFIEKSKGYFRTPWQKIENFFENSYIGQSSMEDLNVLKGLYEFHEVDIIKKNAIKEQFPEKFL